ncbi:DNA polymerase IV [ANME-1 cluster archaeon GoMg4]|nr:DNA polymerase IV [ANME-1 cluster archaeon GoMg4]
MRIILHVDMDSFFSAVEVRENPELKGLPVIVGGRIQPTEEKATEESDGKIRGVVSTCSYEAREYGIHSAMALSQAYKLCPDATVLPVRMALYKKVSAELMSILRTYADKLEQVSIDEAFLDVRTKVHDWNDAKEYAQAIKRAILEKEGLTCSIGVAPNKTIAKIASDFVKPNGLTVVEHENVREFLAPLPVKKIPGVGPKTEQILKPMGIETVNQLASCDVQKLVAQLGKYGWRLHQVANGIDDSEVEENWVRKSLSRETTFAVDTRDASILNNCVHELAEEVYNAIKKEGFVFKTVGIKVKFDDFTIQTRAKTFRSFHYDLNTLTKTAKELMGVFIAEKGKEKGKKIRLVGVRVSQLSVVDEKQRRIE